MTITIKGQTVHVEDWSHAGRHWRVPVNQQFRAILGLGTPKWRIFYGETQEEALDALTATL